MIDDIILYKRNITSIKWAFINMNPIVNPIEESQHQFVTNETFNNAIEEIKALITLELHTKLERLSPLADTVSLPENTSKPAEPHRADSQSRNRHRMIPFFLADALC